MDGAFRGRVLRSQETADLGEADVLVAVFGVPDTNVAVGNKERQVIDQGAFRSWIETSPSIPLG
jgi:hypothetical protein